MGKRNLEMSKRKIQDTSKLQKRTTATPQISHGPEQGRGYTGAATGVGIQPAKKRAVDREGERREGRGGEKHRQPGGRPLLAEFHEKRGAGGGDGMTGTPEEVQGALRKSKTALRETKWKGIRKKGGQGKKWVPMGRSKKNRQKKTLGTVG